LRELLLNFGVLIQVYLMMCASASQYLLLYIAMETEVTCVVVHFMVLFLITFQVSWIGFFIQMLMKC